MNATPLIATIGVIGLGMGYYYTKIHCPDSNMERVDGECTCMEGYYADPDDENSCVALSTTEAPTNNAVLVGGVYVYDADGDAVDVSDESQDIVISELLCKAVEGSSRQAQDGRCLRSQPAATQQKYRSDDTLDHDTWITDYETVAQDATTPPNPISADYQWVFETTETNEAETDPNYTPFSYKPDMSGFCLTDPSSSSQQSF
jgi:hypothetical protein